MSSQRHLTQAAVSQLVDQLGDRDQAIILDLARVRVLTGTQLTRLHFTDLSPLTRDRTRRRVLERLVNLGFAATLSRRIGGVRAGSAGLIFSSGVAAQRALPLLAADNAAEPVKRARRPWTPSALFLDHTLAVSQLYVGLREAERTGAVQLGRYAVESAAWHPDGLGGVLKPDAYAVLQAAEVEDSWWIEVDRASVSATTLRRKLRAYVDFASSGQFGPDGDSVIPRVLVTVPHDRRLTEVQAILAALPTPATALLHVVRYDEAVRYLLDVLKGG